jgi:hypothetical protein
VTVLDPNAVAENIYFMLRSESGLHPDLQKEKVVQELFRAIATSAYQTHQKIADTSADNMIVAVGRGVTPRALLQLQDHLETPLSSDVASVSLGTSGDLKDRDFLSFIGTLRRVMLEASVTNGATRTTFSDSAVDAQANFNQSFIYYFQAYFQGKYVDRFGQSLAAPNNLQTISDNEIEGTVQVFLEVLMDYYVQTPVYYSGATGKLSYFPGSGSDAGKTPTVVTVHNTYGVMPLKLMQLVDPSQTNPPPSPCGITNQKAQAIQYIAQTAGDKAEALGGEIGGGFGGISAGLGVFGKWSIGDNKTTHAVITTALQKTFTRAGEEAAIRVFNLIPNDNKTLAELIQIFLNLQLSPSKPS